jgi:RHS repeat-associated protein
LTNNKGATTIDGALYSYDAVGNRQSKTDKLTNIVSNYAYDPLYELTRVTQGASTVESYSFDAVGNRLTSLNVSSYTSNNSNELTNQPGVTYMYDNNGNVISKADGTGTTAYSWDFEDRLTRITLPGGSQVNFKYDPMGRRIQKSASSGTTNYIYDGVNVLEEVGTTGALVSRYTHGPGIDEPLALLRSGTTSYYEADGLGSVTSLSNSSGALVSTNVYDSFGKLTSSGGTIINPYRFTGRELDSETGLYYYRARYYDPSIGRFINEDPIGFAGGFNFYAYVRNNPINWVDPLGLKVYVCDRKIDGGGLLVRVGNAMGLRHEFIKTDTKEVGMGPAEGGPLPAWPFGIKTKLVDHTGQAAAATCAEVPDVDEQCVKGVGDRKIDGPMEPNKPVQ